MASSSRSAAFAAEGPSPNTAQEEDIVDSICSIGDLQDKIPILMDHLTELQVHADLKQQAVSYLLEATQSQISDSPRICLLGKIGSGKTSLLNAILGVDLLPSAASLETDSGYATTSAVTEIMHDPSMPPGQFKIVSCHASPEEWQFIKRSFILALHGDLDEESSGQEELQELARVVFQKAFPGIEPTQVTVDCPEDKAFREAYMGEGRSCGTQRRFTDAVMAKAFLADIVHLAGASDQVKALLTSTVRVSAFLPQLPRDAVLVDLPGLEDTNFLRSRAAERYFSLQCTHAWFCLPKHEQKLLSNEGIHSQIRVLARGGRLENFVLVRTFGDTRKSQAKLDTEFRHFKEVCTKAQRGLDFQQMPAKCVSVTVAPAVDDEAATIKIDEVASILADIAAQQKEQAQKLASWSLSKVEVMLADNLDKVAEQVKVKLQAWQEDVARFKRGLLDIDAAAVRDAIVSELKRAKPPNGKILRALIARSGNGFRYTSQSQERPYNLRQTTIAALRFPDGSSLENAWAKLFGDLSKELKQVEQFPSDLKRTCISKSNRVRQKLNADFAPDGPVHEMLTESFSPPISKGVSSDKFVNTASQVLLERGVPKLLIDLQQTLGAGVVQLAEELQALAEERFPKQKKQYKRLRRMSTKTLMCIICTEAVAVTRADFSHCRCSPKINYACPPCARQVDQVYKKCPMCRANSSRS
eukprot:TRINITY_DN94097_c0_g1_i1.p1 TRINITY_DN94097_c0_g1~~TRINITY_DN94097_c0_g1_i1.p1  ORF type:complete len:711 (+),score=145.00 TRINITY_DN94097_c0_g1_i1:38-2134(+)